MKIAYLSSARIPTKNAHGIQIFKMCEAFAMQGHEVTLVVPKRRSAPGADAFDFYGVDKIFNVVYVPAIDLFGTWIDERIANVVYVASYLISARILLLFRKLGLVYTREQFAGLLFSDFVYEVHSPESVSALSGFFWKKARGFVSISKHGASVLADNGISKNKIMVAPDAVDPRDYEDLPNMVEARKNLELPVDKTIVMYSGNFREWKGVDVLAEASKHLPDNFFVVLVGGTKEERVRELKEKLEPFEKGIVLPFQDRKMVPLFLSAADILVLPNTAKDQNSFNFTSPLKLFEYMAAGKPIVASDLPSLREILNEDMAVFFPPDNPLELAGAITDLAKNTDKMLKLSATVKKESGRYTWQRRAQRISEHYF